MVTYKIYINSVMYVELDQLYKYVHRSTIPGYLGRSLGIIYSNFLDNPDANQYMNRELDEISRYYLDDMKMVQKHFQKDFYKVMVNKPPAPSDIYFGFYNSALSDRSTAIDIIVDYHDDRHEEIVVTEDNVYDHFQFTFRFKQDQVRGFGESEAEIYSIWDDDYYAIKNPFPTVKEYDSGMSSGSCRNFTFQVTENCNLRCFAAGTKILMADFSYKNIEDIEFGDYIMGFDEFNEKEKQRHLKPAAVTHMFRRRANVIRLTTASGDTFVTPNHKYLTARNRWIEIGNITPNEGLLKITIDPTKITSVNIECDDYKLGYIVGAMIGDGCIREPSSSFVVKDYEMNERMRSYLSHFNIHMSTYPFEISKKYGIIVNRMYTSTKSDNENLRGIIDKCYNQMSDKSIEYLMGFLAAAIDAEGHVEDASIRIYNSDIRYHYYVQQALKRIGVQYTIDPLTFGKNKSLMATRVIGGAQSVYTVLKSCCNAIKRKGLIILLGTALCTKCSDYTIDKTPFVGDAVPVYNIETESGTYIANGMLVHNCSYCFEGSTEITLPDLSTRKISELKIGDRVLGFDEANGYLTNRRFNDAVVTHVFTHQAKCVKLTSPRLSKSIITTPEHPFLTLRGWVQAKDLTQNDWIGIPFSPHHVLSNMDAVFCVNDVHIEELDDEFTVYNLETSSHTFVAGGLLVHNCYQTNKNTSIMDLEIAKSAVDDLLAGNFEYLSPGFSKSIILEFIGGDPLLEIDLIGQIYEYFLQEAYRFNHPWFHHHRISMCSNGMLYFNKSTKQFFDKFSRSVSFNISIDGNKSLHDSCRIQPTGEGSYDIGIAGVKHSNEVYRIEISSKMTLAPSNIPMIKESVKNLCIDNNYPGINLNVVFEDVWSNHDAKVLYDQMIGIADMVLAYDRPDLYFSIFRNSPLLMEQDLADDLNNICFAAGTQVLTTRGHRNIEDIQVGDKVISASGTIMKVVQTHRHQSDHNVTVRATGVYPITCTDDHKFFAKPFDYKGWKSVLHYKPAGFYPIKELKKRDKIALTLIDFNKNTANMDIAMAYALGVFLADGCIDGGGDGNVVIITPGYDEDSYYLNKLVEAGLHITVGVDNQRSSTTRTYRINANVCEANRAFYKMCRACGHLAHNKHVPGFMFAMDYPTICAFCQGYLETDGCVVTRGNGTQCQKTNTVSAHLANDMTFILRSLGYYPTVYLNQRSQKNNGTMLIEGRTVNVKDRYEFYYNLNCSQNGSFVPDDTYPILWTTIQDIVPADDCEVFNITVEGPATPVDDTGEHTIIANGVAVLQCGGTGAMLALSPQGIYYPCIRYMPSSLNGEAEPLVLGNTHKKMDMDLKMLREMSMVTYMSQQNDFCLSCPLVKMCNWCFPSGTMISTDTDVKPIEKMKAGDMVLSHDGTINRVAKVIAHFATNVIRIMFDGRSIVTTTEHPFACIRKNSSNQVWVEAGSLRPGDLVARDQINDHGVHETVWIPVQSIVQEDPCVVYNLTVDHTHTYIADGFVVHNCSGLCYQENGTTNERTTHICEMIRAEYLASIYYWANMAKKYPKFEIQVDRELAPYWLFQDIVSRDEYAKLESLIQPIV